MPSQYPTPNFQWTTPITMDSSTNATSAHKGAAQGQRTPSNHQLIPETTRQAWRTENPSPFRQLQARPLAPADLQVPYAGYATHVTSRHELPALHQRSLPPLNFTSPLPTYPNPSATLHQYTPRTSFQYHPEIPRRQVLDPRLRSQPGLQHTVLQPAVPAPTSFQSPKPWSLEPELDNIVVAQRKATLPGRPSDQVSDLAPLPQNHTTGDIPRSQYSSDMRRPASQRAAGSSEALPAQPPISQDAFGGDVPNIVSAAREGASPDSSTTSTSSGANPLTPVSDEDSPELVSVNMAQTRSTSISDQSSLQRGLCGRDRNPRRAATGRFREPTTPVSTPKRTKSSDKLVQASQKPQTAKRNNKRSSTGEARPVVKKKPRTSSVLSTPELVQPISNTAAPAQVPAPAANSTIPISLSLVRAGTRLVFEEPRPERDAESDKKFVQDLLSVLEPVTKRKAQDMGRRQASRISTLLQKAQHPSENEAKFLTTKEATAAVSSGMFFRGPIITTDQQSLPLQTVEDFLDEYYDENTEVWIQDPAKNLSSKNQEITRKVKMSAIKERFADVSPNPHPWNCLELATHCDDGLRPSFLNTEDCRLLTKLKIPNSADQARRRTYEAGFKEVEKWALLAQAGALTEPHQDSHGYSTYITVNTGLVGFGWLSLPTDEQRAQWRADPMEYTGGNWRYIVLKPGQTVYFPAGTVHFVFRLPSAGNTLAFGGHILRCSNLVHWIKTLIEERDQKNITNEDLTDSATGYLARVEKFVKQAISNGKTEKWGGEKEIEEFLRLKMEFEKVKQK